MNNKAIFWLIGASAVIIAAIAFFVWISVLAPQRIPQPTANNQSPSVSSSAGQDNWQTYRNEQYGFEVKYPASWYSTSSPTGILLGEEGPKPYENPFLSIDALPEDRGKSVEVIYEQNGTYKFSTECALSTVANQPAFHCSPIASFAGESFTYLQHNDLVIAISDYYNSTTTAAIISTLRLTNSTTSTSTWKIYRNEQYGFEFRYPDVWTIDTRLAAPDISRGDFLITLESPAGSSVSIIPFGGYGRDLDEDAEIETIKTSVGKAQGQRTDVFAADGNVLFSNISVSGIQNLPDFRIEFIFPKNADEQTLNIFLSTFKFIAPPP